MADSIITKQELIDAQKDAQTLGEVISGEPGELVETRLGRKVYTLASVPQINTMTREEVTAAVAPKANKTDVDTALSNLSTTANKYYSTLAAANADIANIALNQSVTISEEANKGLWYKATSGTTSLTKSPYDPLVIGEAYTDEEILKKIEHNTSANIKEIKDSQGNIIAYMDEVGELYLPNMQNKSVQDIISNLGEMIEKLDYPNKNSPTKLDASPSIRKLTDAQNAILEFTDEKFGDLYLPNMNNQSVQEHFSLLSERINNMHKTNAIFDAYNDFGIKPNGMSPTETYYKIQIAVNFISKLPDGGTLVFRPGAYKISSAIRPENKVIFKFMRGARLIPVGRSAAFTREPTGSDVALNYLNDAAFIDVEVDGSEQSLGNGSYSSSIKGYYIGGFNRCLWLRNYVHDTAATGIGVDFAKDSFILDSIAQGCGRLAEVGTPGASGIGIGTGILLDESLIIANNICKNNKNFGIFTEWQRLAYVLNRSRNTVITGNICTGNYHGLGDCGVDGLIAIGNQFNDNISDGMILDTGTLAISANRPQAGSGGLIANNQILRNGGNGVLYDSTTVQVEGKYTWSDNNIKNNTKAGICIQAGTRVLTDMSISGGSIHDNGEEAVKFLSGTINNFDIESVKMHRNDGSQSILIDGTVNTGSITDCKIRPASTSQAIKGSGKLTSMWINGNQYVGNASIPVNLTNSENTVTYGSNAGLGV